MLSQHAVEANHNTGNLEHYPSIHSTSTLSQHTLHEISFIKKAAKAQNDRQAGTAMHCTTKGTRARGDAEQAATTSWKTCQEM